MNSYEKIKNFYLNDKSKLEKYIKTNTDKENKDLFLESLNKKNEFIVFFLIDYIKRDEIQKKIDNYANRIFDLKNQELSNKFVDIFFNDLSNLFLFKKIIKKIDFQNYKRIVLNLNQNEFNENYDLLFKQSLLDKEKLFFFLNLCKNKNIILDSQVLCGDTLVDAKRYETFDILMNYAEKNIIDLKSSFKEILSDFQNHYLLNDIIEYSYFDVDDLKSIIPIFYIDDKQLMVKLIKNFPFELDVNYLEKLLKENLKLQENNYYNESDYYNSEYDNECFYDYLNEIKNIAEKNLYFLETEIPRQKLLDNLKHDISDKKNLNKRKM